jgi:copper transport protein
MSIGHIGTASAHAQLEGSDPPANDVVASAPKAVTLSFGESVEVADDAIEVFDDHLQRVDDATVSRVAENRNRIQVGLRENLRTGTYTVSWRVSSSDTHPVSGTFRFSIGAPSQVTGKLPGIGRNDAAGFLLGIVRGLGYVGLFLAPGVLLVALALWPACLAEVRTRRLLYLGLGLLAFSALGSMVLQGAWASSRPLSAIWSSPSSLDSHSRKFDTLYALRFYLLMAFGLLSVAAVSAEASRVAGSGVAVDGRARGKRNSDAVPTRRLVPRWAILMATVASTLILMITWTLAGHAATGIQTPAAIGADLLHVLAMTVWIGGLALLTIALRSTSRTADLAVVLPRFSRLAFSCVIVLVATGSYQAWREVGSVSAALHTTFGRLLLLKLIAVIVIVGLGNLARLWVQRHLAPPHGSAQLLTSATWRRLGRGVTAELAISVIVLGLTSALVVAIPSRQSYVRPFAQSVVATGLQLAVRIDAPRAGDTVLHLTARSNEGKAIAVTGVRGSLSEPNAKLGPLPLRLPNPDGASRTGTEDIGLTFPSKGKWLLQLTVQTSPLDAVAFSFNVAVS